MKHLYAAAAMIEAEGIALIGTNLFIGTIPADVVDGIMLRDPLMGITLDKGMQDFFAFEFQVIVRDPDVRRGYDRALAVSKVLDIGVWENDEILISWMTPCTKPVSYPRGDADDLETSFSVRIGFGEKS